MFDAKKTRGSSPESEKFVKTKEAIAEEEGERMIGDQWKSDIHIYKDKVEK